MTKVTEVTVTYFKPSGKLYVTDKWKDEFQVLDSNPDSIYMNDVVDKMKKKLKEQKDSLPGLCSFGWDGHVLLDHPNGYPCLIPNVTRTTTNAFLDDPV